MLNNLYPEFQSAYRHGHGTETALIRVFNYIVNYMENKNDINSSIKDSPRILRAVLIALLTLFRKLFSKTRPSIESDAAGKHTIRQPETHAIALSVSATKSCTHCVHPKYR